MREDNSSFLRVKDIQRPPGLACAPGDAAAAVAAEMERAGAGEAVVREATVPVGVVTDRSLRRAVAATGGLLGDLAAREVMEGEWVSVREQEFVFEALYKLARHRVHHLVVLDEAGGLAGIVTDTDLLALQIQTPLYAHLSIDAAETLEELGAASRRLPAFARLAVGAGGAPREVVRLISEFHDRVTRRAIELLQLREGLAFPPGAAYLVLGSEGRAEQTLRTDQDSAIVYADELSPAEVEQVERVAVRLGAVLVDVGVPPCPGRTMADNPEWRRSLSDWVKRVEQWISVPLQENMVNFGMFQDLRTVAGDAALERRLKEQILAAVGRNPRFLPHLARNIVRFTPPLGAFRRLRLDRSPEHGGTVNLKRAGIFAVTEGVSLLALEAGILGGSTWDKLGALAAGDVLPRAEVERLEEAFTVLVGLRLDRHLKALDQGAEPSDYVDPHHLEPRELAGLKAAMVTVARFLRALRDRYQLDLYPT